MDIEPSNLRKICVFILTIKVMKIYFKMRSILVRLYINTNNLRLSVLIEDREELVNEIH